MTAALAVIRWFHVTSLMLLYGGALLQDRARLSLTWNGLRGAAAGVALSGGLLWFCLSAAQMGGALNGNVLWLALTQTLFGQVFLARLAVLLLLCLALWWRWNEKLVALFAGITLVLISVTSHAAEASPAHFTAFGITSDGLHLLTAGFWIGGLPVLAMLHARRDENFPHAVAVFAEWGMVAVLVLVLTGMLNATTILLGGQGHDTPLYLSVLGAKLVLVTVMVGIAGYNHVRLLPRLRETGPAEKLDRNVRTEFSLGLVVVGLAVLLSLLPPTTGN